MAERLFRGRIALALLGAIGAVLLLQLVTAGSGAPDGRTAPPGSSYSTNGDGTKAFRTLLEVNGSTVSIVRIGFADAPPNSGSTVVVIGGSELPAEDLSALRDFVVAGGRLVISDQPLERLIETALQTTRRESGELLRPSFPHPELAAVSEVAAEAAVAYRDAGPLLAVLGPADTPVVGVGALGAGTVWAVADASILSNAILDEADNAALALALAGDVDRSVVFAEYNHGYEPVTGLASVPGRWRVALWMAVVAGLVWMLSRGRRLGPPERRARTLPPPRSAYVTAVAASLARTKEPVAATAPVRDRITRELARRGGTDAATIARIAIQLEVEPNMIERALHPPTTPDDVVAAGTVLAKLAKNRI